MKRNMRRGFTLAARNAAMIACIAAVCFGILLSCSKASEGQKLTVYAYDSFVSEWGPGPKIVKEFEAKHGISVQLISGGDAGQTLNRAILEGEREGADIIIGIDNNLLGRALEKDILVAYKPDGLSSIPEELIFDKSYHVIPYDYGYFSIVYDSEKIAVPPKNLDDLTKSEFAKSLILMDPRTSSVGLGFLLWTIAVYGDDFTAYWERLTPSILTITDGWDSGYGAFTSGEAPMVLSYTTSPPYHVEFEHTTKYRALPFEGGNYMQIEGMGILKSSKNRKAAKSFIEFCLSEEAQNEIPLTNWMFPVNKNVRLPDSFAYAPQVEKSLMLSSGDIMNHQDEWIRSWVRAASK
ncbi:MAG TPA: thiamine ABC transporter substrate binding subunit [Spirochaetia bacterium]|nr:thiamine ABC transporter substrate binding subunit [Spirochaetia bacterium]